MTDRTVSVGFKANVTNFLAGMRTMSAATSKWSKDLQNSAQKQAVIKQVGTAFGVMGAAAAAGVGLAVKAAADFDKQMSEVQAATGETAKGMDTLRAAAIQAGADTKFSAGEAADAITALSKAGIDTADILGKNGALNGALALAAAGGQDVASAAESMATALAQFNLKGDESSHVADLLAAAAGKAQGEVSDMSAALNQTGLIANQTGLTIDETTAALAAFANKGLIGSDAGTSFKTMLQNLLPTTEKAQSAVELYNLSAYDQQGNFIGLEKYAGKLHDGLKKLTDEQRNATLKTIFGSDSIRAATVLYDEGTKGIGKWSDAVNDQGFAAETAATKMDNLSGDLEKLRGSLETALIGTGEGAMGPLRDLTQALTDVVNAYIALPGWAKSATLAIGAGFAVIGGGVFVISRVLGSLATMRTSMVSLGLRSETTGTQVGRANAKMMGIRGGAGIAGVALLALGDQLKDSHKGLSALSNVAGAAALGFSVGGPWGAAIGGGIGILKQMVTSTGDAIVSEDELTASFDKQTGAITDATKALINKALIDSNAFEDATKLGISLGDVSLAAYGNEAALKRVRAAMDLATTRTEHSTDVNRVNAGTYDGNVRAADELGGILLTTSGQVVHLTDKMKLQIKAAQDLKLAHELAMGERAGFPIDDLAAKYRGQKHATEGATQSIKAHYDALGLDFKAIKADVKALENLADQLLQGRHDRYAFIAQLDAADKAIQKATGNLDAHTKQGQKNEANIEEQISGWNELEPSVQNATGAYEKQRAKVLDMADAYHASNADVKELLGSLEKPESFIVAQKAAKGAQDQIDDLVKSIGSDWGTKAQAAAAHQSLDKIRHDFILVMESEGKTKKEAEKLADQLVHIPSDKRIRIHSNFVQAREEAKLLADALSAVKSFKVTVGSTVAGLFDNASGSVTDYYARGGMHENHVAQFAPAGAMRVWAEPETGGEAYIPLASSKRARSLDIWEETGRRLGVTFAKYADGAVQPRRAAVSAPVGASTHELGRQVSVLADQVALLAARGGGQQFHGDIHLSDGREFMARMAQARRGAAVGGRVG